MMKRPALVALAIIVAVVIASGLVRAADSPVQSGRVYTVAQVRAMMARNPSEWVGRTVLVRGTATETVLACPFRSAFKCGAIGWTEIDPDAPGAHPLIVAPAPPDALLDSLRRLPLLGRFLPARSSLHEGRGVYQIRLRATPGCPYPSANPSCANATLLAAAP